MALVWAAVSGVTKLPGINSELMVVVAVGSRNPSSSSGMDLSPGSSSLRTQTSLVVSTLKTDRPATRTIVAANYALGQTTRPATGTQIRSMERSRGRNAQCPT
jgi:hypothetical protein